MPKGQSTTQASKPKGKKPDKRLAADIEADALRRLIEYDPLFYSEEKKTGKRKPLTKEEKWMFGLTNGNF